MVSYLWTFLGHGWENYEINVKQVMKYGKQAMNFEDGLESYEYQDWCFGKIWVHEVLSSREF